jgi:Fe-S cluster biosynthesis and repair protein YggX
MIQLPQLTVAGQFRFSCAPQKPTTFYKDEAGRRRASPISGTSYIHQFSSAWAALWKIRRACSMVEVVARRRAFAMDDKCSDAQEPAAAGPAPGKAVRTVKCVKFGREMPGLERIPWKGELGKRLYENVSQEAWKMWIEHSKMVMNEYRLNPLDPSSQKIMEQQMEQFFFGEGARLPEGYVPPRTKG